MTPLKYINLDDSCVYWVVLWGNHPWIFAQLSQINVIIPWKYTSQQHQWLTSEMDIEKHWKHWNPSYYKNMMIPYSGSPHEYPNCLLVMTDIAIEMTIESSWVFPLIAWWPSRVMEKFTRGYLISNWSCILSNYIYWLVNPIDSYKLISTHIYFFIYFYIYI